MALLRPGFGPTLPELVAPRLGWTVKRTALVLAGVLAVLVLVQGFRVVTSDRSGLVNDVLVREPVAFTLGYRAGLDRVTPRGDEEFRLQTRPGGKTTERFTVAPFRVQPYTGDTAGILPIVASREVATLRKEFPDEFRFRGDGRARINLIPGHQLLFQFRQGGRLWYGKRYLLLPEVEPPAQARIGAVITVLAQRDGLAFPTVDAVGTFGLMKGPLRSFRFGTERP